MTMRSFLVALVTTSSLLPACFGLRLGPPPLSMMKRKGFLQRALLGFGFLPPSAHAFVPPLPLFANAGVVDVSATESSSLPSEVAYKSESQSSSLPSAVAYKSLSIPMQDYGVNIPVACWFPATAAEKGNDAVKTPVYEHRISVRKIGNLLARWDWIPEFVCRPYRLEPTCTSSMLVDGAKMDLPKGGPVVLLAHGYLGSRFDLSHLAEDLAMERITCLSAEYPESLAASYQMGEPKEGVPPLNRKVINDRLLQQMSEEWKLDASNLGIVGHSLGCGTVMETGDDTWARVLIAGFPRQRDGRPLWGNHLLVASMNDGAVSLNRIGGMGGFPSDYTMLKETELVTTLSSTQKLPRRLSLVFDRPDAPNHISFLSAGVNDAMIDFLSPLLPVAQVMSIPVLDFDRYQQSRDSKQTADVLHPLIVRYLKQELLLLETK